MATIPRWHQRAACNGSPVDFMSTNPITVALAKAICQTCSVRSDCEQWALEMGEEHGTWAGLQGLELRRRSRQWARDNLKKRREEAVLLYQGGLSFWRAAHSCRIDGVVFAQMLRKRGLFRTGNEAEEIVQTVDALS